jgi:hypothetical protein
MFAVVPHEWGFSKLFSSYSSIIIMFMVLCLKRPHGGAMTDFLKKTWFIWWIIADLAILRWFHLVSWGGVEPELEDPDAVTRNEGLVVRRS